LVVRRACVLQDVGCCIYGNTKGRRHFPGHSKRGSGSLYTKRKRQGRRFLEDFLSQQVAKAARIVQRSAADCAERVEESLSVPYSRIPVVNLIFNILRDVPFNRACCFSQITVHKIVGIGVRQPVPVAQHVLCKTNRRVNNKSCRRAATKGINDVLRRLSCAGRQELSGNSNTLPQSAGHTGI
jgi:hypothetical protein